MPKQPSFSSSLRFLIGFAAFGIVLGVLNEYAAFINKIVISMIMAIVFTPFMHWLQKKGAPVWLSLTVTITAVVLIISSLVLFLIASAAQLAVTIPEYSTELQGIIDNITDLLVSFGIDSEAVASILTFINPEQVTGYITTFLASLITILSDTIMVIIVLAFLLVGASDYDKRVRSLINTGHDGLDRLYSFSKDIWRYVIITNNLGMLVASINTVALLILGVDFALLWGVLSWLFSFVPVVGFVIALIPPTVMALLQYGWLKAALVVALYFLINFSVDNVLKPKIIGDDLDIAPVLVFVSVAFWSMILGPLGGILSIPATLAVKELILEADPASEWIAHLIGGESDTEE